MSLLRFVESGNLNGVKRIIERNYNEINKTDSYGSTVLHEACQLGQDHIVKYLLERGATIDARDCYGRTPLHFATNNGKLEIVKLLLDRGATIDAKDKDGQTPLHWASNNGKLEIVKLLLERGATIDAIANFNRDGAVFQYIGESNSEPSFVFFYNQKSFKTKENLNAQLEVT